MASVTVDGFETAGPGGSGGGGGGAGGLAGDDDEQRGFFIDKSMAPTSENVSSSSWLDDWPADGDASP